MGCKVPARFWIGFMIFWTTYINYITRSNMSLSITAMVSATGKARPVPECIRDKDSNATANKTLADYGPRYPWTQEKQGRILGSYFYGYVISSAPGGYVSECIGPFWTLFIFTLISGVFNSFCVWAAQIHWLLLFLCRFIIGFAAGFIYPALQGLIAQWAPPQEKGKFVAALMGNTLGTCLTWILVGQVTDAAGWAWGFHFLTVQIAIYLVVLWFLVTDTPDSHKWITEEELNYIKESQGAAVSKVHKTKAAPPYLKIFLSLPFWALQICHIGNLYGLYLQLNGIPKFMAEVVGFNIKDSGWTAATPQMVRLFLGMGFGSLGDYVKKKRVNPSLIRRGFVLFCELLSYAMAFQTITPTADDLWETEELDSSDYYSA